MFVGYSAGSNANKLLDAIARKEVISTDVKFVLYAEWDGPVEPCRYDSDLGNDSRRLWHTYTRTKRKGWLPGEHANESGTESQMN